MQAFSNRSINWTMSTLAWYCIWTIPRKVWLHWNIIIVLSAGVKKFVFVVTKYLILETGEHVLVHDGPAVRRPRGRLPVHHLVVRSARHELAEEGRVVGR